MGGVFIGDILPYEEKGTVPIVKEAVKKILKIHVSLTPGFTNCI